MHSKLMQGVLEGNRLQVARAITLVENEQPDAPSLLSSLYTHAGKAHIIGITGAPGTGKSTLVTALAQSYRRADLTVAIVAIDPTSPFSGGALLGDRVRMRALSGDSGAFIRSMATRGSLGGLSKTTSDAVTVLDAAGFDRILVETVGVGQAEIEIVSTAHTTLVVEAPGMGDEVQAIKAGILEIADLLVVNKADRPGVDKTIQALEMVLAVDSGVTRQVRHHGQLLPVNMMQPVSEIAPGLSSDTKGLPENQWEISVQKTVATSGDGVDLLRERIDEHHRWLVDSGELAVREELRISKTIENIVRADLNRRIRKAMPAETSSSMIERIRQRISDPYAEATSILSRIT
ncbi:MAG: methylmalonyl Co-A mutase-associated GTPase MeaB [Chloroflexota bacterium]